MFIFVSILIFNINFHMEKAPISKNLLYSAEHIDLLLHLYKNTLNQKSDFKVILKKITEAIVVGLDIDRCSFWQFENEKLVCIDLFDRKFKEHFIEKKLFAKDIPIYFEALKDGIAIVADDAKTNEYTRELKESYLIPLEITDILDLPIRENGELIGVLCCERRNGNRKWNEIDLAFARSITDILSLVIEQTKRQLIQNDLIESQRKLSLITNNSKDGFVVFEKSEISYISPSYRKSLGYTKNEIAQFTIDDVFNKIHPEEVDEIKTFIYNKLKKRIKHFKCSFRFRAKSGEYFWREDTASVLYDENGRYEKYIIISRDISAIENAKSEIEKLYSISKGLNERLLDFTHIISHNIRSNTSNISMIIRLMDESKNAEEKEVFFQLLKESNTKLIDTVNCLNETIGIQLNSKEQLTKLNLQDEINKILKAINAIIKSNNVTIKYDIPTNFEIKLVASYLESIILNLITNAIKYRSDSRGLIVVIKARKVGNKLEIEVIDNGSGIDLIKNKDKIFGMYKTFHGNSDAIGLGLFMTKNHIEALGGTIDVKSKVGFGSEFKISFYE